MNSYRCAIILSLAVLLSCAGCRTVELHRKRAVAQQRLETGTAAQRIETLQVIAKRPPEHLRPLIEHVLADDPNPVARALAADALGNLRDSASIDGLRHTIQRDIDPSVRKRALISLAAIKQEAAEPDLIYIMQNDRSPLLKITALDLSVNLLQRGSAINLLQMGIADPADAVRITAYNHLRSLTGLDIPPDFPSRWQQELSRFQ